MFKSRFTHAAAVLASCALLTPQVAMAQQCIEEDDLSDAIVYFMPIAYSAFTSKCAASLSEDGFINTRGDEFIAPYVAQQDDAWAGTYRVFKIFADKGQKGKKGSRSSEMLEMFDAISPDVIRPFVDAIVQAELAKVIKSESCEKVERLLEPMAPLPPDNLGALVARTAGMIPDLKDPGVCAPTTE